MLVTMDFAGRSSMEYGVYVKTHRPLRPAVARSTIRIPGRDGEIEQDTGTYEMRTIAVDCIVARGSLLELRQHVRQVAAWLSRVGRLSFSDEPDKYYVGRVYNPVELEQLATWGTCTVNFDVQPFAFGEDRTHIATGTDNDPPTLRIAYGGTAPTPCRIIVRNDGPNAVGKIRIFHRRETGGDF